MIDDYFSKEFDKVANNGTQEQPEPPQHKKSKAQPVKKVVQDDFDSAFDEAAKKKVSTEGAATGTTPTPSVSEAPLPSKEKTLYNPDQTFTDKTGKYNLNIPEYKEPTPQEKLEAAGKNIAAKHQAKEKSITDYNNRFGTALNPQEVLSDPDKSAGFLHQLGKDYLDLSVKQTEALHKQAESQSEHPTGNFDFGVNDHSDNFSVEDNFLQNTKLLRDNIVEQTVNEQRAKGLTDKQTVNNAFRRLAPKQYEQHVANVESRTGEKYDENSDSKLWQGATDDMDVLRTVKAPIEFQLNEAKKRQANEALVMGTLENNNDLLNEAKQLQASVKPDEEIYQEYPILNKSRICAAIGKELATKTGQLEGTESAGFFNTLGKLGLEKLTPEGMNVVIANIAGTKAFQDALSNPTSRQQALDILHDPSIIPDATFLGGIPRNALKPAQDLFYSVEDLVGSRDRVNRQVDDIKKQLFPEDSPDLKDYVHGVKTIVNTTALLGGYAALAEAGAAPTAELALSETGAKLGLSEGAALTKAGTRAVDLSKSFFSFGLNSADANLTDADKFLNNDVAKAAYATSGAIINTIGGELLNLPILSKMPELQKPLLEMANKISDGTITKEGMADLLEKAKDPYVDALMKYGVNVTKNTAVMKYFAVANGLNKMAFGGQSSEDVIKEGTSGLVETALGVSVLSGLGVSSDIQKGKNSTLKNTLYKLANNYDAAKDLIETNLKNGTYTQQDYNEKVQILNTATAAKNTLDQIQKDKNIVLEIPQKTVYISNLTSEGVLRKKIESDLTSEEDRKKYEGQAAELKQQRQNILNGLTFDNNLVPQNRLFAAENEFLKAKQELNDNIPGAEERFIEAKKNFVAAQVESKNKTTQPEIYTIDGKSVTKPEIEEILKKGKTEVDKYDIQYEGADNALHTQLQDVGGTTENNVTTSPKSRETVLSEGVNDLYGRLEDKAPAHYLDPLDKQKSIEGLTNQVLESPNDIKNDVGKKLAVELIARNSTEDINNSIEKWQTIADKTGENVDEKEKKEANRHIELLNEGLEEKGKIHEAVAKPIENERINTDVKTGGDEPPPEQPATNENELGGNGIGISKKEILDKFGKEFEKTKIGWNDVSKNALNRLHDDAIEKNTSIEKEAESQVSKMAKEIINNRLTVSEDRIVAATFHLINIEEKIDNIQNQKVITPDERAVLAIELDMALEQRDMTLKVIDSLGTKSGRNLGLFAGFFSKIDDGGVTITRRRIEGTLGFEIPMTEKELDDNENMSQWQKDKARPYIKKIEEIKKDFDDKIANLKKQSPSEEKIKKEKKKAADAVRAFASKVRNSDTLDKIGLGKSKFIKIEGKDVDINKLGFSLDIKDNLADALEYIADQIDKAEDLLKLISDASKKYKGKNDEGEFKNLIQLATGNLPELEGKHLFGSKDVPQTFDINEDALNENMEIQRRKTLGQLNQLSRQAEESNREWYSKALDWRRSFLIGGIKTLGRVAISGVSKYIVDPLVKQTLGRVTSLLPGLKSEKVSLVNTAQGFESLVKFKDKKAADNYINDKLKSLETASKKLDRADAILEEYGKKYGKNSNKFQKYQSTEYRKTQQEYKNAELGNAQAAIYKWINGNGFKDAKDLIKYGSTDFEQAMGGYGKVNTDLLSKTEKWLYYLETINRLHAVLKNPSARRALVETYNSKLEHYQEEGIPLTASARMRALDIAYGEFLSGKYQEKTQLNDYVNLRKHEGQKPGATNIQKAVSGFFRIALPVAKVGVNIVKTGVDMSTVGVEGVIKYIQEVNKGIKLNEEQGGEYNGIYDKLIKGAKNIPEKEKVYINKVLSRGLFGLGLMATAAYGVSNGSIQYGGEFDEDHKAKRKYKDNNGHWHTLDYGQWAINGEPLGKFASSVLNHLPEFLPVAMVVNSHNVYQYENEYKGVSGNRKLKDKPESFYDAFKSDINEVSERLPYKNLLKPEELFKSLISLQIAKDVSELFDYDKKGNLIERKPTNLKETLENNIGLRKLVPEKKK